MLPRPARRCSGTPDCGCSAHQRRARELEAEANRFAASKGERLPTEDTKRLGGDLFLGDAQREHLARKILPTLSVTTGQANVESHGYYLDSLDRFRDRLDTRARALTSAVADHERELKDIHAQLEMLRMVAEGRTGADLAKRFGRSRPVMVDRIQKLLAEGRGERGLRGVITVPCRFCGRPLAYTMGKGRRRRYCEGNKCRQGSYWASGKGAATRRSLRALKRSVARRVALQRVRRRAGGDGWATDGRRMGDGR